jgi:hypothetical protein
VRQGFATSELFLTERARDIDAAPVMIYSNNFGWKIERDKVAELAETNGIPPLHLFEGTVFAVSRKMMRSSFIYHFPMLSLTSLSNKESR